MSLIAENLVQWHVTDDWPDLGLEQIHLWWAQLDVHDNRLNKLWSSLSAREQDRASRFRLAEHRNRYVAGRGIAREMLGRYLDQRPSSIHFQVGSYGKPALAPVMNGEALCFNYTDSAGRAIYAFARDSELGIDLECLDREVNFERIVKRRFTKHEGRVLLDYPDGAAKHAFLACWTRKEAYGKAKGVGLCYPLDSVELCVNCAQPAMIIPDTCMKTGDKCWTLRQFHPREDFIAALVYAGNGRRVHYFHYARD